MKVAKLDLVEHLLDVRGRYARLILISPMDGGEFLRGVRPCPTVSRFTQSLANPFGGGKPLTLRHALDLPEFVILQQDLKALCHSEQPS